MGFNIQKITTTNKTQISSSFNDYSSMIFTNNHATDDVTLDLYVTAQITSNSQAAKFTAGGSPRITDTGTNVNNGSGYAITTYPVTVAVDGTTATSDAFLNERVYDSGGNLYGICTAVHASGTPLTFLAGLAKALVDDASLFTGTRYYLLNNIKIPNGASLKLTPDEFNIDTINYNLYIKTNSSDGGIDIITRY